MKHREGRRGGTRPEATEEVGGTSLAFFEPADTSTQGGARGFLSETVVQLLPDSKDLGIGVGVPDVASGTAVGGSQATFKLTAKRLTLTGGNNGEILGVRAKNDLGSVPVCRRVVRAKPSNRGSTKIRGRKKESVVTPQQGWGIRLGREGDLDTIMVTARKGE